MKETSRYLRIAVWYPLFARGFYWLTRIRLGSFWSAARLAQIGWLPLEYRSKCPFCLQPCPNGEDVEHLLSLCPAWNDARNQFLSSISLSVVPYFNLLGGSNDSSGLSLNEMSRWWCPRLSTDDSSQDVRAPQDYIPGVAIDDPTPGCVMVAKYLQHVVPLRLARLRPLLEVTPRADASNGMAVLAVEDVSDNVIDVLHQQAPVGVTAG